MVKRKISGPDERTGRLTWRCACLVSLLFWPAVMTGLATGPMVGGEAPFTPLGFALFLAWFGFMLATLVHAIRNAREVGPGWILAQLFLLPLTCNFYYLLEIDPEPLDALRRGSSGARDA